MFEELSYKKFKKLAEAHRPGAVYKEIQGDQITPPGAFRALGICTKEAALLESSLVQTGRPHNQAYRAAMDRIDALAEGLTDAPMPNSSGITSRLRACHVSPASSFAAELVVQFGVHMNPHFSPPLAIKQKTKQKTECQNLLKF